MIHFNADPRDGFQSGSHCSVCCCVPIYMKPGERNSLVINYAMWTAGFAGPGITVNTWFDVNKITPDAVDTGNGAPIVTSNSQFTPINTALVGTLVPNAVDPEAAAMTWKVHSFYGAQNGTFVLNTNGTYTYTPNSGFEGVEHIYYEVSDGFNTTIGQLMIRVGANTPATAAVFENPVEVISNRKKINVSMQTMSVPINVNPQAVPGDLWRVNVRQEAIDCDGNKYYHVSCYDIHITKC